MILRGGGTKRNEEGMQTISGQRKVIHMKNKENKVKNQMYGKQNGGTGLAFLGFLL